MSDITTTPVSSAFERLPLEIINQILADVSKDPKAYQSLKTEPSLDILTEPTQAGSLGSLSLVSKSLRNAVLPHLFRHIHIVLCRSSQGVKYSAKFTNLITFLDYHNLNGSIHSLAVGVLNVGHSDSSDLPDEAIWWEKTDYQWKRLLKQIGYSLRRLTIIASPHSVGKLLSISLSPYIDEALHMPYHSLVLQRQAQPSRNTQDSTEPLTTHEQSPLSELGWTSLVLNEGSFLRWHADHARGWQQRLLSAPLNVKLTDSQMSIFRGIKHLTYISIVPPYQHILDWMTFLAEFTGLEELTFQTQPVTDILPDFHQRGSASFFQLEENRDNVYVAILLNLIQNSGQNQLEYTRLRSISCIDPGAEESTSAWVTATERALQNGWTRKSEQEMNVIVKSSRPKK